MVTIIPYLLSVCVCMCQTLNPATSPVPSTYHLHLCCHPQACFFIWSSWGHCFSRLVLICSAHSVLRVAQQWRHVTSPWQPTFVASRTWAYMMAASLSFTHTRPLRTSFQRDEENTGDEQEVETKMAAHKTSLTLSFSINSKRIPFSRALQRPNCHTHTLGSKKQQYFCFVFQTIWDANLDKILAS